MTLTRAWGVVLMAAVIAGGCATGGGDDVVIGERSDARTRAKAHTELAAGYYELGNMGVALDELKTAIKADSDYARAYDVQGLVFMELRENDKAESSFERALRLAPNDPGVLHNYGWFLCQTGREKESIPHFMKAIAQPLYQAPAKSYAAAGQCSLKLKNDKDATEFFNRALRLDPNNLVALPAYAEMNYRLGRMQDARAMIGRYNKLVPPTAASLWLALRIERRIGDRAAEASYAVQLRQRFQGSKEYQNLVQGKFE